VTDESTGSAEPVTADGETPPRSSRASPAPAAFGRRRGARIGRRDQGACGKAAHPWTAGADHRRHRDLDVGSQLGRGVLDGHRLHLGAHAGRHRGGDRHRLDGTTVGLAVVGAGAGDDPRWCARQSGGPVLPLPGPAARPRRRLLLRRLVAGVQRRRPRRGGRGDPVVGLSLFGYDFDTDGRRKPDSAPDTAERRQPDGATAEAGQPQPADEAEPS